MEHSTKTVKLFLKTGNNTEAWLRQMQIALSMHVITPPETPGVYWRQVNGDEVLPAPVYRDDDPETLTAACATATLSWRQRDDYCKLFIVGWLDGTEQAKHWQFQASATAKQLWDRIKAPYMRVTRQFAAQGRREIYNMSMADEDSLADIIDRMELLNDKLTECKRRFDEQDMIDILMAIVPARLDAKVQSFDSLAAEDFTWDFIKNALIKEDARQRQRDSQQDNLRAFLATKDAKSSSSISQCSYCGKAGHVAKVCRRKLHEEQTTSTSSRPACEYCFKPGHSIKDCYSKAKDEKSKKKVPYRPTVMMARLQDSFSTSSLSSPTTTSSSNTASSSSEYSATASYSSTAGSDFLRSIFDSSTASTDLLDEEFDEDIEGTALPPAYRASIMMAGYQQSESASLSGSMPGLIFESSSSSMPALVSHDSSDNYASIMMAGHRESASSSGSMPGLISESSSSSIPALIDSSENSEGPAFPIGTHDVRDHDTEHNMRLLVDSGSDHHMVRSSEHLTNYRPCAKKITLAAGAQGERITGIGDLHFTTDVNGQQRIMLLKDVLHVPSLNVEGAFGTKPATRRGFTIILQKHGSSVVDNGGRTVALLESTMQADYLVGKYGDGSRRPVACGARLDMDLLHQRLGHINEKTLLRMRTDQVLSGLNDFSGKEVAFCEGCVRGRHTRAPFRRTTDPHRVTSTAPLELVHTDVCGPFPRSMGGHQYYLLLIDDYTNKKWFYPLKHKSDTFPTYQSFNAMVKAQRRGPIVYLQCDGGGEFINTEFKKYLAAEGTQLRVNAPYTHEHNPKAERGIRTITEKLNCMLKHAHLASSFWAEAGSTATFVDNLIPTAGSVVSPEEAWTDRVPRGDRLRVFGAAAWARIPKENRKAKTDDRSRLCIFLGYSEDERSYRLWDPARRRIVISRDVHFDESMNFGNTRTATSSDLLAELSRRHQFDEPVTNADNEGLNGDSDNDQLIIGGDHGRNTMDNDQNDQNNISGDDDDNQNSIGDDDQNNDGPSSTLRRSSRLQAAQPTEPRYPARERTQTVLYNARSASVPPSIPTTETEALSGPHAAEWQAAMDSEYQSLLANDTWDVVSDLPHGRKAIGTKFIYKVKTLPDGTIDRYKARLVAQGFRQTEGVDFFDTYSPVAKMNTVRAVFAVAAARDLTLHQADVRTAFLHAALDEDIYVKLPWGQLAHLRKSLYGLKQAPLAWNKDLTSVMKRLNFAQSQTDPCLFTKHTVQGDILIVAVWVDDLLIAGKTIAAVEAFKAAFGQHYDLDDLGEVDTYLGVQIHRDLVRRTIALSVEHKINALLRDFNMTDCKPVSTPLNPSVTLCASMSPSTPTEIDTMSNVPYRSAVGALLYLAVVARPDISAAVGTVARYQLNPGMAHWTAVKRILRYLKGTANTCLIYNGNQGTELVGFSDSDWAGCIDTRRSTTGYVFIMGGAAITWQSKRQPSTALSSMEAEYMALAAAAQEAIWLRRILIDLGVDQQHPTVINEDNQGCISFTGAQKHHSRAKHIDIRYNFIREAITDGEIKIVYCPTEKMIADILTKSIPKAQHITLTRLIGANKVDTNTGLSDGDFR